MVAIEWQMEDLMTRVRRDYSTAPRYNTDPNKALLLRPYGPRLKSLGRQWRALLVEYWS